MASPANAIEFHFDFSCPYAYLASLQLDAIEVRTSRPIALRPFLLGGVFAAIGQAQNLTATLSPAKQRHNRADLLRQAAWIGARLQTPGRHPNRTVDALRTLLVCPIAMQRQLMASFFAAYWQDGADLSDPTERTTRMLALGLPAADLNAAAEGEDARKALRDATDAALAAGIFGAPAFVVDGALYWGADRVEMVVHAARSGWQPLALAEGFQFGAENTR